MAGHRTTIILDEQTRRAARELAQLDGCSTSDAIRRAVLAQRRTVLGVSEERRRERLAAFRHLIQLFEGHDAAEELARLKAEDEHL